MRKLIALVVVLVLFLVADSAARVYAGERLSSGLASALNLDEEPEVVIGGFPFLFELARGDFENISVSVDEFGAGEIVLDEASLTLREVSFSPLDVLGGDIDEISVRSGRGTARLNLDRLEGILRETGRLVGDVTLGDLPGVNVEGRTLSLGPVDLELPVMTDGMSYDSAELVDGAVRLEFSLDRSDLSF